MNIHKNLKERTTRKREEYVVPYIVGDDNLWTTADTRKHLPRTRNEIIRQDDVVHGNKMSKPHNT